ncbi:NAD(P)-dependent oxidoreductase [Castellaniella sp. GW247-6E4]|uniref:NAD(P)-dependent oxidoreductase n=1 Tax=Castellaniella sp. GW247-6E4 TaxID=3140380 RepID=UPI0033151C44
MTPLKVLFTTAREARHQKTALDTAPAGAHVEICVRPTPGELARRLPDIDVLVTERLGAVHADAINGAKRLKLIQRLGRMTQDIDLPAARAAGIPVCNWPLRNCAMVAEHMMMQILALAKRFRDCESTLLHPGEYDLPPRRCDANYFAINWTGRRDIKRLADCTVGIMGFGEVGCELAVRLKPFGCKVLYHKRKPLPPEAEELYGVDYADHARIRADSDFLCLLLPHMADNGPPVGHDFLAGMKPGACLISAGASSTLDELAVAEAYRAGRLSGVATDGWSWEPTLPDNLLLRLAAGDATANLALSPHTAGGSLTDDDILTNRRLEWSNVRNLMSGERLLNRIA